MIFRLLFCSLLGTFGVTLLATGVLCDHLTRLFGEPHRDQRANTFTGNVLDRSFTLKGVLLVSAVCIPSVVWLVGRGVWTWATAGYVAEHWSRVVLAGLVVFVLGQMFVTTLVVNLVRFHTARRALRTSHASLIRAAERSFVEKPAKGETPELVKPTLTAS